AWDRFGGGSDGLVLWDLLTDRRYGLVAPQVGGEADRWLAVIGDPTGAADPRRQIRVAALGVAPTGLVVDGLVAGVPHPPSIAGDPLSAPLPRRRVDPVRAVSTVTIQPGPAALTAHVDSQLVVRAVGGEARWIDLEFEAAAWMGGDFQVLTAELADGTPLLGRPVERRKGEPTPQPPTPDPTPAPIPKPGPRPAPAPQPPEPEPDPEPEHVRLRLLLPTPLAEGAELQLHVVHEDLWQAPGSGLQWFLPDLGGRDSGMAWPFTATVGVPVAVKNLVVTVSGETRREYEKQGWRLVEASSGDHPGWWPGISAGWYTTAEDPAQLGFPSIRTRLLTSHFGAVEAFGPEVRRVVQFYQGWLPEFPVREIEVLEEPRQLGGFRWVAAHGMIDVQQMSVPSGDPLQGVHNVRWTQPHLENAVFAHELAHQYFGHLVPPASREDFWIAESFSELFSCMYVAAAFGAEDCRIRQNANRKAWEGTARPWWDATLSGAYQQPDPGPVVYDYGPYMLGEMLQRRIGLEAFFGGIDLLLREHPHEPLTTERLVSYFEGTSGKDLDPFFAYWVYGGTLPAIDATWSAKGRSVTVAVTADVPFGTFDVPVRVKSDQGEVDLWVTVVDGAGTVTAAAPPGKVTRVSVDPDGWVLATRRSESHTK
ncbi:MAG: M1 family aminopeptidase, partial [Myxococcota bacterium]